MDNTTGNEGAPLTLGQMRVGISFNPGGHEQVNQIKRSTADQIDYLESQRPKNHEGGLLEKFPGQNQEKERLISLAQTHLEDAAMWAVKAVTK